MVVRNQETGCASTLTDIVITDQHGLTAAFHDNGVVPDSAGARTLLADIKYPNLRLDITGAASSDGTSVSYTYTLRDSAQGNNTTGTNAGDIGTPTSVSFAGVPLPDVSPNRASAWAQIGSSGMDGTFWASVQADSASPCGSTADYAVELYAQTGAITTELAAHGNPSSADSAAAYQLTTDNDSLISDCRGFTTNLYLKLSCTSKTGLGTSFKLVALQSQIPNSPYTGVGPGSSHVCANAALGLVDMADLTTYLLNANAAKDHPGTFLAPAPVVTQSNNSFTIADPTAHYTVDGSAPTCTDSNTIASKTITADTTVMAISCPAGRPASAVGSQVVNFVTAADLSLYYSYTGDGQNLQLLSFLDGISNPTDYGLTKENLRASLFDAGALGLVCVLPSSGSVLTTSESDAVFITDGAECASIDAALVLYANDHSYPSN